MGEQMDRWDRWTDGTGGQRGQMGQVDRGDRWTEETDGQMGQVDRWDRWTEGTGGQRGQMDRGDRWTEGVRISPVALRLGSEMDPYQRDLTNILHSTSSRTALDPCWEQEPDHARLQNNYLGLSQLRNTSEIFRERCLRLPPGLSMFILLSFYMVYWVSLS